MGSGRAEVERLSIPELNAEIRAYAARTRDAQTAIEHAFARAAAAADAAVKDARGELASASRRPSTPNGIECHAPINIESHIAAMEKARVNARSMEVVAAEICRLEAAHRVAARRYSTAVEVLGQAAQRELRRAEDSLDAYLGGPRGSVAADAAGMVAARLGGREAATTVSRSPGLPSDVYLVPLALIDDADTPVRSPADFHKGYTAADLEWAHEAFASVVLPGIASGRTLEDFRARDICEGRVGVRSYSDTYSGFLGDSAIKLERHNDQFAVKNGYHRVWIARQMGLECVPARIPDHDIT